MLMKYDLNENESNKKFLSNDKIPFSEKKNE